MRVCGLVAGHHMPCPSGLRDDQWAAVVVGHDDCQQLGCLSAARIVREEVERATPRSLENPNSFWITSLTAPSRFAL
jgi:hypothetical protein